MRGTSTATEIRWFAPGEGPALPLARPRRRTDRYHLDSLSPDRSLKARGRHGRLEVKLLVGTGVPVGIAGGLWRPEVWVKSPMPADDADHNLVDGGRWIDVGKRIWRRGGLEVCHVELDGAPWWTMAVKVRNGEPAGIDDDLLAHLATQGPELLCCGYPSWLLARLGRPVPPERTAVPDRAG